MNIDPSIFDAQVLSSPDAETTQLDAAIKTLPEFVDRPTLNERSEQNLQVWSAYLSPECINSMIRMRWDRTT